MTDAPRQLAIIHSYEDLHAALRARVAVLGIVLGSQGRGDEKSIDDWAGLPDSYISKLLSPIPMKTLGKKSLGPTLSCLGCMLILVEDYEAIRKFTSKLKKRKHPDGRMLTVRRPRKRRYPKLGPEWGRFMAARRFLLQSVTKRKAIGRAGAKARWPRAPRRSPDAAPPAAAASPPGQAPGRPPRSAGTAAAKGQAPSR